MFGKKAQKTETQKNKHSKNYRYSIKLQFTLIFILVMASAIVICLLLNTTFLKQYYYSEKRSALSDTYESLNEAAASDSIKSDAFDVQLEKIVSRNSIGVIVMDTEATTVKSYATDSGIMVKRLYDNLFGANEEITEEQKQEIRQQTQAPSSSSDTAGSGTGSETASTGDSAGNSAAGSATDSAAAGSDGRNPFEEQSFVTSVLQQTDKYTIQNVFDKRTDGNFMEMWGTLDNGDYFLLRTAVESIDNSAAIANRFFGITGVIATLIGVIVALFMGSRITKPILELTDISGRMSHLDFSAKYKGKSHTEIADLGGNINELSESLEHTISELKTANNQLQQDIQKKEEIDTMRKEFLSNVTHELKTPIALIQGYAEGLQDCVNDDPESRNDYAGVIVDEAGKMNSMVQKLLALNHLEFGTETVNMEHFDITAVLKNSLETETLLADRKDVTVRMEQNDPIMVWADSFLTEEVFTNYFSNAVNHVEEVAGEKIIDIKILPQEGERVRVTVFNTGRPIPEESLPHIWEKFYKVDKARTRAYGGSGIGLSIVKAVMDLMHQAYGVKNFDNGVEFWFELDASVEEPEADAGENAE